MSPQWLEFVSSGRVFALVIAVMACEALLLGILRRVSGRGIAIADMLASLGAGMGLAVAALLIAEQAHAATVGIFLGLALIAHLVDLSRRWER